ncbi:hypothetical protein M413DRAFT_18257 [Hebeloma cylindrosporum]|uniref:Uncharacterized protein n=1 Tax=Hebeloma cylindrosporum TaxID=76867 RepID=A0A0C2YQ40_HEBCY|nr:hypothetical protein M413DRAFT_18257 [Hebeloma cylindrosporum h7]
MDYDQAWCPTCDRQIQPKRTIINVPVQRSSSTAPPPPPPSSPRKSTKASTVRKGGLLNGTGRVRPNGTIKPPPVATKQRTVIDQGPTPLYCSDECEFADINSRRGVPLDPAREEPTSSNPIKAKKIAFTTAGSETESDASSSSSVYSANPSLAKMAKFYNWDPLPPPPPVFDDPEDLPAPPQYNSGIMMAGRLLNSLAVPPAKPQVGPHRPPPEPRKVVPGWTDGSNAWRSAIYSFAPPKAGGKDPFNRQDSPPSPSFSRRKSSRPSSYAALAINSAPAAASAAAFHSASDDLINKFSENFSRRCESRTSLYQGGGSYTATPPPSVSSQSLPATSPKRERSILHRAAEGKLLAPDVKLKVHSGSSASLSSAWSGPASTSSRRSVRSPLSAPSDDSDEDTETCAVAKNIKVKRRPVENTRSWSYDNVKTYDIMQVPQKKIKKIEKQIQLVDGEEVEVEVEVEVYEPLKRLFNFAPSMSRMSPT